MYSIETVVGYKFGPLEFKVKNPRGLFFMTDGLKRRISEMTIDDAKEANKEAWKRKRSATSTMKRYNNATIYGNGIYDDAAGDYQIADAVAKETYRRIRHVA